MQAQPDPQLLIFHSFSRKKSLFLKISDGVIACDLRFGPRPNPNQGYAFESNHVQCAYQIPVVAS